MEYEMHPMTPAHSGPEMPKLTDQDTLECFERKLRFHRNQAVVSETLIAHEQWTLDVTNRYCEGLESDIARLKAKIEEAVAGLENVPPSMLEMVLSRVRTKE